MPFVAGLEEDGFLQSLNISLADIEPKADRCTRVRKNYDLHKEQKRVLEENQQPTL